MIDTEDGNSEDIMAIEVCLFVAMLKVLTFSGFCGSYRLIKARARV